MLPTQQNATTVINAVQKQATDVSQSSIQHVINLADQLAANKGIIPDSWKPILDEIKLVLTAAEFFCGSTLKSIIEIVKAAINTAEGN